MRRLLGVFLATVFAAGCGGGGGADLNTVAAAIREVEQKGAAFNYTDTVTETGGNITKGMVNRLRLTGVGEERDDNVTLVLTQLDSAGKKIGGYDVVINDVYLFVRPHGTTRDWFVNAAALANPFYPGVRLNLLRETVLLSTKNSKSVTFNNGAVLNQYLITPALDQLVQLASMTVTPDQEASFIKSAAATITAYLNNSGHLQRLDFHLSAIDPASSLKRVIDSSMTFSRVGRVSDRSIPATAISVQPADMFSTAATPSS